MAKADVAVFPAREDVGLDSRISSALLQAREWIRLLIVTGALMADGASLVAAAMAGSQLRFGEWFSGNTAALLILILPAHLLAGTAFGAYRTHVLRRRLASAVRGTGALVVATGFAFSAAFVLQVGEKLSRLETTYMLAAAILLLVTGRACGAALIRNLSAAIDPTIYVFGDGARELAKAAGARHFSMPGLQPSHDDPRLLDEIANTFRNADRVILCFSDLAENRAWAEVFRLSAINAELLEPSLADLAPITIDRWRGCPTVVVSRGPLSLPERAAKRLFDLCFTLVAAPIIVPAIAILTILVKIESPGPAFFAQKRVGRHNRQYVCYKLRTMRLEAVDPDGSRSTSREDHRITRIGRVLRRTSLDELPQFWNVFVGNMSVVGPRPHALGSTAEGELFWRAVRGYWNRHAMKPGLTGLAQVRGFRGATSTRQDIESRVAADLEYINRWSIWLDVQIVLRTLGVIVHRNAF